MLKFVLFIVALAALAGCSPKDEDRPVPGGEMKIVPEDTISSSQDVTIGSPTVNPGDTAGQEQYMADIGKRIKKIENNELVKMLPDKIPGTEKLPADIGNVNEGGTEYKVVTGTYKFPKGQVTVELTDFTSENSIPESIKSALRKMPPPATGVILGRIEVPEFWGFNYYNERLKAGYIRVIVAGRFYVQIGYDNVPIAFGEVAGIISMMNIKGMMKYKS